MTSLEQHTIAEGLVTYLQSQSKSPLDGIAILGLALLIIFDSATRDMTIEEFAENFRTSMLESWKGKSDQGSRTVQ